MEFLVKDGHAHSQSFKHEMMRSPAFRESLHTRDIRKARTMLKLFGATDSSLAKLLARSRGKNSQGCRSAKHHVLHNVSACI